ncbi:N-acetylneuraminate synthase family protein [Lysinibacillus sp. A4]|uniref:N-acetylneuraminate synthase family protein n=1 Tax=Lysinibacillus sp. A4 TaxID=2976269 RepID=UPI0021760DEC|nr:N-acetylneuraminate synthase family protein [Lysinibacillus sp. A4]MCS5503262.1 N-acetylneuraminate synthase family protein [Lysinibacillus sp. A4]
MGMCVLRDGIRIGNFERPYFVAEINSSHNGNLQNALDMVIKAKKAGCHCVKFQSWTEDSLYAESYYDANPISKRIVRKFSFSNSELKEISIFCKANDISFASTPYSNEEVDFLINECDVPFIKIASMELNNHTFLKYIASKKVPIILSTGMGSIEEIRAALKVIEDTGNNNLCLLHCVSIYPTEIKLTQLNNILGLREEFPQYTIGFSDHSLGIEMAVASVALGACLIEKHFTLNSKKIGMDNQMATEPAEFTQLIKLCNNVFEGLGTKERIVSQQELEQRNKMRRSIVASRDLKRGEVLKEEDLICKRPGEGLPPNELPNLIGKELKVDVKKEYNILLSDIN